MSSSITEKQREEYLNVIADIIESLCSVEFNTENEKLNDSLKNMRMDTVATLMEEIIKIEKAFDPSYECMTTGVGTFPVYKLLKNFTNESLFFGTVTKMLEHGP